MRVSGGEPLPRDLNWVARVCTPYNRQHSCSVPSTWTANVTLCVEGRKIQATMHSRGHSSLLFPKVGAQHATVVLSFIQRFFSSPTPSPIPIPLILTRLSLRFSKHQFDVRLAEPVSLLGLPKSHKFVLGMPFIDTSFMRNQLAFALYRDMGGWAPKVRMCLQTPNFALFEAFPAGPLVPSYGQNPHIFLHRRPM
jgi:hypothetical protein